MAPNSPPRSSSHPSIAGSRSTAPLNRSKSALMLTSPGPSPAGAAVQYTLHSLAGGCVAAPPPRRRSQPWEKSFLRVINDFRRPRGASRQPVCTVKSGGRIEQDSRTESLEPWTAVGPRPLDSPPIPLDWSGNFFLTSLIATKPSRNSAPVERNRASVPAAPHRTALHVPAPVCVTPV